MFIITVQTFSVSEPNSLCFPCMEKVRTKFPVFPVSWPPCTLGTPYNQQKAIYEVARQLSHNVPALRTLFPLRFIGIFDFSNKISMLSLMIGSLR